MKSLVRITKRQGRCYELACNVMLDEPGAKRFTLVHGNIFNVWGRIDHAWIEVGNGLIYDPTHNRYETAAEFMIRNRAEVHARYSQREADRLVSVTGNVGPWTDIERQCLRSA